MARESKDTIEEFRDPIQEILNLTNDEVAAEVLNGAKALEVNLNADLSAIWKIGGVGHAVKTGEGMPCHVCAIEDKDLVIQNPFRCDKWCNELHLDKENWNCYHQKFLNKEAVDNLRKELEELKTEISGILSKFDTIQKKSVLNMQEDPTEPLTMLQVTNKTSIHYDTQRAEVSTSAKEDYERKIHHDLKLRNLSTTGELVECQQRLKTKLIQEYNYKKLVKSLNHVEGSGTSSDANFILLSDCPPCILHMEMRTTLKFLQVVVNEGLKHVKRTFGNNKSIENYVQTIQRVLNEEILGTKIRPSTVSVKYNQTTKVIDDLTLDGKRCRKVAHNFKPLLDVCILNRDRKDIWLNIIENYNNAFEILRSKENLEFEKIKEFQRFVDIFFKTIWNFMNDMVLRIISIC